MNLKFRTKRGVNFQFGYAVLVASILLTTLTGMDLTRQDKCKYSISLDVHGESLMGVLNRISGITGYHFEIKEHWHDISVTANFADLCLEEALNRVLKGFNCAVIYEPDETVKIIIIGKKEESRPTSNPIPPGSQPSEHPSVRITRRSASDSSDATPGSDLKDSDQREAAESEASNDKEDEKTSSDDASSGESESKDEKGQEVETPTEKSDSKESASAEKD